MRKLLLLFVCFCMVAMVFDAQIVITPPKRTQKVQSKSSTRTTKSQPSKRTTTNRSRTTAKKTTRPAPKRQTVEDEDWWIVDSVAEEAEMDSAVVDYWDFADEDTVAADTAIDDEADNTMVVSLGEVGIPMRILEGGTFYMGATTEQQSKESDEKPVHEVTLRPFCIGVYEITQAQWAAMMGNNPSYQKDESASVDNVSWNDVQVFLSKLNEYTGAKEKIGVEFRLPTEAEWEFAARGGNNSVGYRYSGGDDIDDVAWYKDNSDNVSHSYPKGYGNELSLYDMSGNLWEWCQDWYGADYYSKSPVANPRGPYEGKKRVVRGGAWDTKADGCRVAFRGASDPNTRARNIGFRIALTVPN